MWLVLGTKCTYLLGQEIWMEVSEENPTANNSILVYGFSLSKKVQKNWVWAVWNLFSQC